MSEAQAVVIVIACPFINNSTFRTSHHKVECFQFFQAKNITDILNHEVLAIYNDYGRLMAAEPVAGALGVSSPISEKLYTHPFSTIQDSCLAGNLVFT